MCQDVLGYVRYQIIVTDINMVLTGVRMTMICVRTVLVCRPLEFG